MSFNRFFVAVMVSGAAAGMLFGCSGQNQPYDSVPQIELAGTSCMDQIPTQIHDYFNGQATAGETTALWGCFHYTLSMFSKYVQSPNASGYTPQGLREFFEKYFLIHEVPASDGHVISDRMLAEIMEFKRIIIGGSATAITQTEVNRAVSMIDQLQSISLKLLPYAQILFANSPIHFTSAPPSPAEVDSALQAFNSAAVQLVALINPDRDAYTFAHVQALLQTLHNFLQRQNPTTQYIDLSKYIPLFSQLKSVLLNSNNQEIEPSDWSGFAHMIAQIYDVMIREQYFFSTESFTNQAQLNEMVSMFLGCTDILKEAAALRSDKAIPLTEIDPVLDQAITLGLLPSVFDAATAHAFTKVLFDTVLNPQNAYPQSGVSVAKIDYLNASVNSWAQVQQALINGKPIANDPDWNEMAGVLDGPWPLREDLNSRLIFDWSSKAPANLASMSRMNWARACFHMVFEAYITDKKRLNSDSFELSKAELHQAYTDLKPMLVWMNLIDANDTTYDQTLFRDGNLFMPRSNDGDYLTFDELVEYVQYVLSGIDAGNILTQQAPASCTLSTGDFNEACFRSMMQTQFASLVSNMPGWVAYMHTLSPSDWQSILTNVEKAVRDNGASTQPMTQSEIDKSFILLQYIETWMMRFDTNHDGKIGPIEALRLIKFLAHFIAGGPSPNPAIVLLQSELRADAQQIVPSSSRQNDQWWIFTIDRGKILQIIAWLS